MIVKDIPIRPFRSRIFLATLTAHMDLRKALGFAIRRRRVALGITQTKFAEMIGYEGQSSVSRLEHGQQDLPAEVVQRIADSLNCRVSELWADAEEGPEGGERNVELSVREPSFAYARRIPLISWVSAGLPADAFNPYAKGNAEDWIPSTAAKIGPKAYALRVKGESMTNPRGQPTFPSGTVIIVDPAREPRPNDFVIVRFPADDEATFKRLVQDAGRSLLVPLNPQYPTIAIEKDAAFCGVVISKPEEPLTDS